MEPKTNFKITISGEEYNCRYDKYYDNYICTNKDRTKFIVLSKEAIDDELLRKESS